MWFSSEFLIEFPKNSSSSSSSSSTSTSYKFGLLLFFDFIIIIIKIIIILDYVITSNYNCAKKRDLKWVHDLIGRVCDSPPISLVLTMELMESRILIGSNPISIFRCCWNLDEQLESISMFLFFFLFLYIWTSENSTYIWLKFESR